MNPQVLEAFREDGKRLRSLRDRKSTRLNSSHSQISYAVSFDRKSTRLNSSHSQISYAVFCLKKKNNKKTVDQELEAVRDEGPKTTRQPRFPETLLAEPQDGTH